MGPRADRVVDILVVECLDTLEVSLGSFPKPSGFPLEEMLRRRQGLDVLLNSGDCGLGRWTWPGEGVGLVLQWHLEVVLVDKALVSVKGGAGLPPGTVHLLQVCADVGARLGRVAPVITLHVELSLRPCLLLLLLRVVLKVGTDVHSLQRCDAGRNELLKSDSLRQFGSLEVETLHLLVPVPAHIALEDRVVWIIFGIGVKSSVEEKTYLIR